MEAYELLIPEKNEKTEKIEEETELLIRIADLIKEKKTQIRKITGDLMDDLILEISKLVGLLIF
jgi:hypothetical protein